MTILRIVIGVILGIACKLAADQVEKYLLKKREKAFCPGKKLTLALFIFSGCYGGFVCFLIPSPAKAVYLFLLLIVAETVTVTDLLHRLIPNDMVFALLLLSLGFGIPYLCGAKNFPEFHLWKSLLGFGVCFLIFLLPSAFSKQVGAGDVKLAAAIGFSLGLWNSLVAIVLMGALVLALTFLQKQIPTIKYLKEMIPMGPFLSLSLLVLWILTEVPFYQNIMNAFPF